MRASNELAARVDGILDELMAFQARHNVDDLQLFNGLVSAEQYRHLYYKVTEFARPGSHVLDWGCGGGHFSFGLSKLGYTTCGYAFDDFVLRGAIPNGFELTVGTPEDPVSLPYRDGAFDAVISMGVLEHVRETGGNELESMRELRRVLRPGGQFLCFHLPNRRSLIEWLNLKLHRAHHHLYKFDPHSIRRLCDDTGLELIELGRYGALPRNGWNHAPEKYRDSRFIARAYNRADQLLAVPFSAICQNYWFVARNPTPAVP